MRSHKYPALKRLPKAIKSFTNVAGIMNLVLSYTVILG
jgi:hypothetical protein